MIKAIIFDCFGVLATDGWLPFRDKYFGKDQELFSKVTQLNREVDGGFSSFDAFIGRVSKLAGISQKYAKEQIENNVPNEKLFEFIRKSLKPNYKIGMLSNAAANWLSEIFLPQQVNLFDAVSLSYEARVLKPDKEAYMIIARKLDVLPSECVFIDDQKRYCDGAGQVGMKAINYTDLEDLKNELATLLNE